MTGTRPRSRAPTPRGARPPTLVCLRICHRGGEARRPAPRRPGPPAGRARHPRPSAGGLPTHDGWAEAARGRRTRPGGGRPCPFFPRHPAVLPQAALLSVLGGSRLSPRHRRARVPGLAASRVGRLGERRLGVGGGAAVAREGWSVPILRPLPPSAARSSADQKKKKPRPPRGFYQLIPFRGSSPPPLPHSPPPPPHTHRAAARVGRLRGRPSARGRRRRPGRHLPAALPLRAVGQGEGRVGEREQRGTARGRAPHDARPPTPRPAPRRPPPPRACLCVPVSPLSHCISSLTKKIKKPKKKIKKKKKGHQRPRVGPVARVRLCPLRLRGGAG